MLLLLLVVVVVVVVVGEGVVVAFFCFDFSCFAFRNLPIKIVLELSSKYPGIVLKYNSIRRHPY